MKRERERVRERKKQRETKRLRERYPNPNCSSSIMAAIMTLVLRLEFVSMDKHVRVHDCILLIKPRRNDI